MSFPMVALAEVLSQYKEYINSPESKIYPKLSVKLYGKGVVLDTQTDGTILKMKRHQIAKSGQVILSEIWGKKGAIGFVPPKGDGALCTSHFFLFDVNNDKLESKYLQLIFTANYLQDQLDADAKGTTGYAAVRPKNLLAAKIPLPLLAEQRRIVARIEELAAKIDEARGLRKKAGEELEALLAAKLNEIFSPNRKNNLQIVKIAEVCNTSSGGTPSRQRFDFFENGTIPWIKSGELKDTFIKEAEEYITQGALDDSSAKIFPNGTLLIALYGANVGMTGILGLDASTNQAICAVFPKKELLERDYLYWFFRKMRPNYLKSSFGGAQPNISQKMIRETEIAIPPLPEQRCIVAYLDSLQAKVDALRRLQAETNAELDALMPAVLDRAFKGEM
jgi:type I restriction enzyme S subunit